MDRQSDRHVLTQTSSQRNRYLLEALVRSDEGERVLSCTLHQCHVQGDREGGDTQLEALLVGVNP